MIPAREDALEVFLQPGEHFVGDAGTRIRTLLGSCVSIVLWHPGARIGAMTHFLLGSRPRPAPSALDARYGDEALELVVRDLARAGVEARHCEGKVFGGGRMFGGAGGIDVGRSNGATARRLLQDRGIPIVSENLYGAGHRQIVFDIDSGDVWVRHFRPSDHAPPRARAA